MYPLAILRASAYISSTVDDDVYYYRDKYIARAYAVHLSQIFTAPIIVRPKNYIKSLY